VSTPHPPCVRLAWDSQWWRLEVVRVLAPSSSDTDMEALENWCSEHRVDVAMALVSIDDTETLTALTSAGFTVVDERVTLRAPIGTSPPTSGGSRARRATSSDLAHLRAIAATNHRDSRFYADAHFPRERCDEMFGQWIENDLLGRAALVLVIDVQNEPVGYLSLHYDGEASTASIGLIGVSPHFQRRGLGQELVVAALAWCEAVGAESISVVTQGSNHGALFFYETQGFLVERREKWLHRWWSPTPDRDDAP